MAAQSATTFSKCGRASANFCSLAVRMPALNSSAQRWPAGGLPAYREVAAARIADPLRFAVAVSLDSAVLKTSDAASAVTAPKGRFYYAALGRTGAVTVSSAAETYFTRPERRADGRQELATLFRPYWQARLAPVTPQEALLDAELSG